MQRPIKVEMENLDGLWYVVKIHYPKGHHRFGLRRYLSEGGKHFFPVGKTVKSLDEILDIFRKEQEREKEHHLGQNAEGSEEDRGWSEPIRKAA
jgi:hypothetical protein